MDDADRGTLDLDDLWALLDGGPRTSFESEPGRRKMVRIAFDHGPADWTIRSERFWIGWRRSRSRYVTHAVLPLVATLMDRCGLASVPKSTVAGMPTHGSGWSGTWSFQVPDYVVWFDRHDEGLDVALRPPGPGGLPSTPQPIPDTGPDAMPELFHPPVWRPLDPSELVHRDFPEGYGCPHCGERSERFRALGDGALVCPSCGRTFRAD